MNALQLEEHKGRGNRGYDTTCKLCREEREDIVHFITNCRKLEGVRDYDIIDGSIKEPEERMRVLLFRNQNHILVGKLIRRLWDLRKRLLKQEEGKNQDPRTNPTRGRKKNKKNRDTV